MFKNWPCFDQLTRIAKENPEQLEALRTQEIEAIITQAPESMQRKLRGLQFKIDCVRRKHKNPLGSCIAISKLMNDSLDRLNQALQGELSLNVVETSSASEAVTSKATSNVVAFPVASY